MTITQDLIDDAISIIEELENTEDECLTDESVVEYMVHLGMDLPDAYAVLSKASSVKLKQYELKQEFQDWYIKYVLYDYYEAVEEFLTDAYTPEEYKQAKELLDTASIELTVH